MEDNRSNKADRMVISGSIRTISDFEEVQGVGFELTVVKHGSAFVSSKKELMNKILTPVLLELSREEEMQ